MCLKPTAQRVREISCSCRYRDWVEEGDQLSSCRSSHLSQKMAADGLPQAHCRSPLAQPAAGEGGSFLWWSNGMLVVGRELSVWWWGPRASLGFVLCRHTALQVLLGSATIAVLCSTYLTPPWSSLFGVNLQDKTSVGLRASLFQEQVVTGSRIEPLQSHLPSSGIQAGLSHGTEHVLSV